jgi:hypothetical protein
MAQNTRCYKVYKDYEKRYLSYREWLQLKAQELNKNTIKLFILEDGSYQFCTCCPDCANCEDGSLLVANHKTALYKCQRIDDNYIVKVLFHDSV